MSYLFKGVDVSGLQGEIDWKTAKENGVEFAILKATAGNTITDSRFHTNVKNAKAAGVPIGAYHFFYGSNEAETRAEAEYFLKTIKGYSFDYPLVMDVEGSALKLPKDTLVNLVELFCDMVEEAGYYVSIYSSASPFNSVLNDERLRCFDLWVAQWSDKEPNVPQPYGMWQYSNNGSIPGIPNRVDLDYSYKNYPLIMKQAGLNGHENGNGHKYYTVKKGESFWSIAQSQMGSGSKYYKMLAEYNGMTTESVIHPGDILKIPNV